ncbi:MAG: glycoside hydrolase [Streptosporangiales bacterium]|nr:glycoside hydrolase [Streptosporangiales bacterium]
MRVLDVESTDLFAGSPQRPLQVVRVSLRNTGDGAEPAAVRLEGPAVFTPEPAVTPPLTPGAEHVAEVGIGVAAPYSEGAPREVTVVVEAGGRRHTERARIRLAATGWTMFLVPHFHYDPVWWNTQNGFTESWYDLPPAEQLRDGHVRTAFDLVRAHLDEADRDPDYRFVLAELDYVKPHWDAFPDDRRRLRGLLDEGRLELVGGTYNEPSTNLTSAESTVRNLIYGIGYQRDVLGGDPRTAWLLDVFGHDPGFPGLAAAAGLTGSAWARGPFHQWGPRMTVGDNTRMQFPAEFEWISPDGSGLLTSYMANHYGAGWDLERAESAEEAVEAAYRNFRELAAVAATRNVLLPVGADHVIPSRWATAVPRAWAARYVWPRFQVGLPREFFAAVREDAARRKISFTPQSRDMNPLYTGKDVSYIDTKQGQRAAEVAVDDAERLATLASLAGAPYPHERLDKAWRQLLFGAHHDAITGSESDQVYLDLVGGWREAYELGRTVRDEALAHLAARGPGPGGGPPGWPMTVANTLSWPRNGIAEVRVELPAPGTPGLEIRDAHGAPVRTVTEGVRRHRDGSIAEARLRFPAQAVPALGRRTYTVHTAATSPPAWRPVDWTTIGNAFFTVTADPRRGGGLAGVYDRRTGRELLAPGGVAGELVVQEEYRNHPDFNEGPWHLLPKGPGVGSAAVPATVRAFTCRLGRRLVARYRLGGLRVAQEVTLWEGLPRVEFRTHVDGALGEDRLLRVRFPLNIPGTVPVYETANAAVARSFGYPEADAAEHPWTLDNPCHTWAGLSVPAVVALIDPDGSVRARQPFGVAEVIAPPGPDAAVRDLVARLAGRGVTATRSRPDGPRYGCLDLDSNLPDVRIAIGGPDVNHFTARLFDDLAPAVAEELIMQLKRVGRAWIPARMPRREAFAPTGDARCVDVRDIGALPVLVVAGHDLDVAVGTLAADLADAEIDVVQPDRHDAGVEPAGDYSVALLNRGTPSVLAEADGTLYLTLMRSCTGWPSGTWITGSRRTPPGGGSFSGQAWTHTFEYALTGGPGDWRDAQFAQAGREYNHALLTHVRDAPGSGELPAASSLLEISPRDAVLSALKPRGNPLASGAAAPDGPVREVVLRLTETTGHPVRATVTGATPFIATSITGLTENDADPDATGPGLAGSGPGGSGGSGPGSASGADGMGAGDTASDGRPYGDARAELLPDGRISVTLGPAGTTTIAATPSGALGLGMPDPRGDVATEPATPVFTRYWKHDKGAAPLGYLPAAVHVSPGSVRLDAPGETAAVRVTVATSAQPARGTVQVIAEDGLDVEVDGDPAYDLPPHGHAELTLRLRAKADALPGRHYLAARVTDAAGRAYEDVVAVDVAGATPVVPLAVSLDGDALRVAPGASAEIVVGLDNRARSEIRGEAQVISPYGTWDLIKPWSQGFAVPAGRTGSVRFRVTAPPAARPGSHWWALVKVMYFGEVTHTDAIPVEIAHPR